MSGAGSPEERVLDGHGLRVAIVAARWHTEVSEGLVSGAERALHDCQVSDVSVLRVPGAFELPVTAKALAAQRYDAVVALGVVIRGGTPHFEYVCQAATDGLAQVAVDTGVPVGFGLLTCDTTEQALDRCGRAESSEDKGREAAMAAVETALLLRKVRRGEGHEGAAGH
ncbi:MAG: 6,7-dimethyl-8-ribityllumazine synthase [Frankiaceae bacterium]|nr:6,7-dimethyl-8-ribityllumazine synthase [Frankiaceae bacterium]MBV9870711.1 6,7-dimethyl-8-ribityllumazine synthase [Frankiaceae bacterium]